MQHETPTVLKSPNGKSFRLTVNNAGEIKAEKIVAATFAKIDSSNIVTTIIVIEQDVLDSGIVGDPSLWVQSSHDGSFRKNRAGVGYTYDKERDVFISSKPFDSWILNEDTSRWNAPIVKPDDNKQYTWNDDTQAWDLLPEELS